jgi:hypothetical protein
LAAQAASSSSGAAADAATANGVHSSSDAAAPAAAGSEADRRLADEVPRAAALWNAAKAGSTKLAEPEQRKALLHRAAGVFARGASRLLRAPNAAAAALRRGESPGAAPQDGEKAPAPGGAVTIGVAANGVHSSSIGAAPAADGAAAAPAADGAAAGGGELVALNPRKKLSVPLIERRELSHNVRLFRFGLPSPQHKVRAPPPPRAPRPRLAPRRSAREGHVLALVREQTRALAPTPVPRPSSHPLSAAPSAHRAVWPAVRQARVPLRQDRRGERHARLHADVQGRAARPL